MEFPFLSIITLSPIVAAVIILMLPKERGENARMLGLAAMLIGVVLSIYVYVRCVLIVRRVWNGKTFFF